ncbi:MAG: amidohydrolase family protein [Pseudomonadota bacterium]|nr:amidohydrolase family protein [Pseudomonadota bacterium]
MIVDAHLHCSGRERTDDVLRSLDDAGVDVGVLLAPFLDAPYSYYDRESLQAANRHLASVVGGHADRLVGLAVINPSLPGAREDLRHAIEHLHLTGVKMVPSGWYPYDDCAHAVYEEARSLSAPILFHSGIFIDGRSGRYCRPVFFEALRDHPGLKVTLAHLGWPWCDEANAVGLIDLINGVPPDESQFRFDISFGPPPVYRLEVLQKAVAVLTANLLQFGSDRFLPCSGAHIRSAIDEVHELFDKLDLGSTERARVMGGTAAAWLARNKEA